MMFRNEIDDGKVETNRFLRACTRHLEIGYRIFVTGVIRKCFLTVRKRLETLEKNVRYFMWIWTNRLSNLH